MERGGGEGKEAREKGEENRCLKFAFVYLADWLSKAANGKISRPDYCNDFLSFLAKREREYVFTIARVKLNNYFSFFHFPFSPFSRYHLLLNRF